MGRFCAKRESSRVRGFLLFVCLALALSGCGSRRTETGDRELVIGVSINSLRSPFMIALKQGIQEAAEEEGVTLIISDCNGNLQTQSDQIRDFIVQRVDGILAEPLDADALIGVVEEANGEGIPVYCVDTTLNCDDVICTISSDSVEMGRLAAEYIAEQLYEKYGEYRGKVANLLASMNSTSGLNRTKGFHEVMDEYPDIEIVAEQNGELQLDTAVNAMTNILQANGELDAIWCSGDTNAQGSLQAMKWLNRLYPIGEEGHIILVSADGASESLSAVRSGYMDACISQNPLAMGRMAVQMLIDYLRTGEEPEDSFSAYPLFTITSGNIDSEELAEYGIWVEEIES